MPINDSAGVGVHLIDKSQRASAAIGFRSAGAIEADRGLCNTPTLITSEDEYVKTFGTPSMSKHGLAAMEAYLLAQRQVPQVLVRAKNPMTAPTDKTFGVLTFTIGSDSKISVESGASAKMGTPLEPNTTSLYFKGEGTYCASDKENIVIRLSEPTTQSAYAKANHVLNVQVFDFNGSKHIDNEVVASFAFNPDLDSLVSKKGEFQLDGYTLDSTGVTVDATAFINGRKGVKTNVDYAASLPTGETQGSSPKWGLFDILTLAICDAEYQNGTPVISSEWQSPFMYSAASDFSTYGTYSLDSRKTANGKQELNCFNTSISVSATAKLKFTGTAPAIGVYNYPCGSVTVTKEGANTVAIFNISTSLYLQNRNDYMFMGKQNENWAAYYNAYLVESKDVSFSYDDYDANYVTIQADAVLGSSSYLVSKTSETFDDYTIDYAALTDTLKYFPESYDKVTKPAGVLHSNDIGTANKSYAYSQALSVILQDNLTRWRCVATPNLGDAMNPSDYLAAITSSGESTLGLSNIGRAASVDVFNNLTGRHGNRFIADYSQYAYRSLAGKRTAITMATLVADLLNSHYNDGIEARPPFGYNYGQIACMALSQQFSGPERDMLARQYKINPVIEDGGYFIWEEHTSQATDTSLSDIHCILSFIWMKFAIYDAMKAFVAEYNDAETVNRGLMLLRQLNQTFITRNYIEEGIVSADKNVIGDEVLRFDYAVRFKGVARFVDVYITAYSQTQTLAISLAQEA